MPRLAREGDESFDSCVREPAPHLPGRAEGGAGYEDRGGRDEREAQGGTTRRRIGTLSTAVSGTRWRG
jgi:hypothetical protein